MASLVGISMAQAVSTEDVTYNSMIFNYGMTILARARALKTAVYVIEAAIVVKITSIITETILESGCDAINQTTDIVTSFSISFR